MSATPCGAGIGLGQISISCCSWLPCLSTASVGGLSQEQDGTDGGGCGGASKAGKGMNRGEKKPHQPRKPRPWAQQGSLNAKVVAVIYYRFKATS